MAQAEAEKSNLNEPASGDELGGLGVRTGHTAKNSRSSVMMGRWKKTELKGGKRGGSARPSGQVQASGSQAEARKKAREDRRKQREQLEASRPDEDADDPQDVAAIEEALNNMGDYKLKSSEDYVVPLEQVTDGTKYCALLC